MLNTEKSVNSEKFSLFKDKGISTIEIIIVVAIITVAFTSLLGVLSFSLNIATLTKETNQANFLAQETVEAVRNFRDGTIWDTDGVGVLATSTSYHPEKSGSPLRWTFPLPPDPPNGEETIGGFTRGVIFEKVSRDPTDYDIEEIYNSSNDDSDTRKVIVNISWEFQGKTKNVELVTYLTNWKQ